MKEKYPIKGSNTLYKVWGIIVLVLAALAALLYLLVFILVIAASSALPALPINSINEALTTYTVIGVIFLIVTVALDMTLRISTGIVLVRDYIKSTGVFIVLAVIYFLLAGLRFLGMILSGTAGSVVLILSSLIGVAWNIATGIILIFKSKKADMSGSISEGFSGQVISPHPVDSGAGKPLVHGMIEGAFGEFQGKKMSLTPGMVYKIGRETGCDIQLVHPKVSRVHCTVCMMPDGRYQITDYSYNGTFYENKRLAKNIPEEVSPGGMLVIGEADNVLLLK